MRQFQTALEEPPLRAEKDGITVSACAKLNLSLDVLGRLDGGYHALRMVMQSATLCDDVTLEWTGGSELEMRCNFSFLPLDGRNIAIRAAREFLNAAGLCDRGLRIRLHKRIPVGAGLGGGSADAAAVLLGLNELTGAPLRPETLAELGLRVGSDVPYCLHGGTCLAEGRGELLEPLEPLPDCGIVICKPAFSIRTADLFARIDGRHSRIRPDTEGLVQALRSRDLEGVARRMYNVFEEVLPPRYGEIVFIKQALLDVGALGAVMTGTGSAVFGIFPDAGAADAAADALTGTVRECFSVRPVP